MRTIVCSPRRASRASLSLLLVALCISPVHADDRLPSRVSDDEPAAEVHREPSGFRWMDGPRRVPSARGGSKIRAESLGLGTLEAARMLLRGHVEERWLKAAQWSGRRPRLGTERPLTWPVEGGHFGRGFGFTRRERPDLRHNGIDVGAPRGSVVRAADDGIVGYSDNGLHGFGNCILIVHASGLVSLYGHNDRNTVQAGWRVERGERIAFVGSTGLARGPHLHFELREAGRIIDPMLHLVRPSRRE